MDATFHCVPVMFYQCLIVMVYNQALGIYVPVLYILMSGKTKECYMQAFGYIKREVPGCDPYCVGVDFERAFFTAVRFHFPKTLLIGCLFHFKQAGVRKMEKLGIPDAEIKIAMVFGVFDLLTVLPRSELEERGVPFVRTMIMNLIHDHYFEKGEELDAQLGERRDKFWEYFM